MSTNEYGVSLIQQYKKCQKINQQQLRDAKNIEDLVSIKIETIDKQLVNKDNTYNFHYDPLQFRQQIPLMGDRTFLINQAILQKSSQKQRYAPSLREVDRDLFSGNTTKRDYLQQFAHAGMDLEEFTRSLDKSSQQQQQQLLQQKQQYNESTQNGDSIDFNIKNKDGNLNTNISNALQDSISKDPVQILKQIFKKKEFKKRPMEANQIADKYRKLQLKQQQKEERRLQIKMLNQKQFKEDGQNNVIMDDSKLYDNINMKVSEEYQRRQQYDYQVNFNQYDMQQDDELMESKFIREPTPMQNNQFRDQNNYSSKKPKNLQNNDYQALFSMPESVINKSRLTNKNENVLNPHQNEGQSLKERLDNLRRMFEDEEQNMIINDELDNGVIDYDLKIPRELTSRKQKKQRAQSEDTSVNVSEDEIEKEDLKQFLTNKIHEIKRRMNHQHPNFDKDQRRAQKYKASTLCKIQAVKNYGYDKLEEHFKNRMNKTGVDVAFKNAVLNQEKKQQRHMAQENERQLELLAQHKREAMTAPQKKKADTTDVNNGSRPVKTAKDRNYVFAQIMKIEKINKETEKRNQIKKEEIKNDDILQIIEDTKKQIKEEEQMLDQIEREQNLNEQLYIQELLQNQLQLQNSQRQQSISPMKGNEAAQLQQYQINTDEDQQQYYARSQNLINQINIDREVKNSITKQDTDSALRSEQYSEISPINKIPIEAKVSNRQVISSQQTILNSQRARNSTANNQQPQVIQQANEEINEYGILFKPENDYYTDSEILNNTMNGMRQIGKISSKILKQQTMTPTSQSKLNKNILSSKSLYKAFITTKKIEFMKTGLDPILEDPNSKLSMYNFSPRRFNRYPRFTIFLKQNEDQLDKKYVLQNTVSLNPQFLAYLMENQQNIQIKNIKDIPDNQYLIEQAKDQGIIIKNEKSNQTQVVDPFEKVILVKGIDNSILTSFRTLRKQNNLISDTMKVIHNKFQPFKSKGAYFKMSEKALIDKMPYPLTDNEDAIEIMNAKILADNYRFQQNEVAVGQTIGSRENTQYDDSKIHTGLQGIENSVDLQGHDEIIIKQQLQQQMFSPTSSSRERMQIFADIDSNQIPTQRNVTTAHLESQMKSQQSQNHIRREKSEENKLKANVARRNKLQYPRPNNQQQEQILHDQLYFNSKKNTFQHDSRLMTANQDSYVESQDDHTLSDIIQGQKYSSKVINQFSMPNNQQISQEQQSLMLAANSPINATLNQNTTFQIPSNEPPQKISIHTKFKRNLNQDLNNVADAKNSNSPTKSPNNKDKKETIILTKIDPTSQAFPHSLDVSNILPIQTIVHQNQQQPIIKKANRNPFRSLPNRRQVKPIAHQRLELTQLENPIMAGNSTNNLSHATFGERQSQTAKVSQRRQSQFEFKSSKLSTKAELNKSINQNMFKQHQVLPPLLQNQYSALQYNQTLQSLNQPLNQNSFKPIINQLPMNNTSKIKQVIDDLYSKEKRYTKQYARDDLLQAQNPIFNLNKYQNLQTYANIAAKTEMRSSHAGMGQSVIIGPNLGVMGPSYTNSTGMNIKDESIEQQRRSINMQQSTRLNLTNDVMIPNQYNYMNEDFTGSIALTSTFKNTVIMNEMHVTGLKQ